MKQVNYIKMMGVMREKDANTLLLPCDGGELEHITEVVFYKATDEPLSMTIENFLERQYGFWKRIKIAFRYVFNLKPNSDYEYNTVVLNEVQIIKLRDFINKKLKEK